MGREDLSRTDFPVSETPTASLPFRRTRATDGQMFGCHACYLTLAVGVRRGIEKRELTELLVMDGRRENSW